MSLQKQRNTFEGGINLDTSYFFISNNQLGFSTGLTVDVNVSESFQGAAGGALKYSPLEGSSLIDLELPAGNNVIIGSYYSEQTNELYCCVQNSEGDNCIYAINGDNGFVDIIYQDSGNTLEWDLDPQYFVAETRVTMFLSSYDDPETGEEKSHRFFIFTNGRGETKLIETVSSRATQSFTQPSSGSSDRFYNPSGAFFDPIELIFLGVPTPIDTISATAIPSAGGDLLLQNNLNAIVYQFRIKTIDIFGRESIHGIISDPYMNIVGGGCIANANNQPRCLELLFKAGNPLVQYIQVEYRKWVGNQESGALASGWLIHATIQKYVGFGVQWWSQQINTTDASWSWNSADNTITYKFCGDGLAIPVDPNEAALTMPGIPRWSNALAAINESLLLANNFYNFDPIDPAQIAKLTVTAAPPAITPCNPPEFVTVTVYATIFSDMHGSRFIKFDSGKWGFGETIQAADQLFADQDNPGFIVYPAGMPQNAVIGTQGYLDSSNNFIQLPFSSTGITPPPTGSAWVQQFVVRVPKGKGLLRMASHKVKVADNYLANTSTYVNCILEIQDLPTLAASTIPARYATNPTKEIPYDCSTGSVTLNGNTDPMFLITDCSDYNFTGAGYLVEDQNTNSGIPIEMQPVLFFVVDGAGIPVPGGTLVRGAFFTDHNGFYFAKSSNSASDGSRLVFYISLDVCDGAGPNKVIVLTNGHGTMVYGRGTGTAGPNSGTGTVGNYLNSVSYYNTAQNYPSTGRINTIQPYTLCDGTSVLPGIVTIMTKGAVSISDNNGVSKLISHNRYNYDATYPGDPWPLYHTRLPDYSISPYSTDYLIVGQKGGCSWSPCSTCGTFSRANITVGYIACTGSDRTNTLSNIILEANGVNIKGVQSGGRYGVGIIAHDRLGRHTFVQQAQGDAGFVNVPNLNDNSFLQFNLCQLNYAIDASFNLPDYFTHLTFAITDNVRFSDFFMWPIDQVQFVDNTGNNNSVDPSSVRIYYNSLNQYCKQYGFQTNNQWDFIADTNTNIPVDGDIVEFIYSGTGTWPGNTSSDPYKNGFIDTSIAGVVSGPVTYDKNGAFFTVLYSGQMAGLTAGTLFKVIRPRPAQTNYTFYEQSLSIPLVGGVIADTALLTGIIPFVDSYLLNRAIPVPIPQNQPYNTAPGQRPLSPYVYSSNGDGSATGYTDNNNANNNNVIVMSLNNALTSFPFFSESPSPSDFWGSHTSSKGRIMFTNKYESASRLPTEIFVSYPLNARPNGLNGLSYFEKTNPVTGAQNAVSFPKDTWGAIMGVMVETSRCVVITESDNFMVSYNYSQVKTDSKGNLLASAAYGIFTAPDRNAGTNYGCTLFNINTIRKYNGIILYLDAGGYMVKHNFSNAEAVEIKGYAGYLQNKIATLNDFNLPHDSPGTWYFIGGINPRTWEYYLTSFCLFNAVEVRSYINIGDQVYLSRNETLVIDMTSGVLKRFDVVTPEYYGLFSNFYTQRNFINFKEGKPWIRHHGTLFSEVPYCNFFGEQTYPSFTIIVNGKVEGKPDTYKRFLATELYLKEGVAGGEGTFAAPLFFAANILTEKGQISRLPLEQWTRYNDMQCSGFLCAVNTVPDPNLPVQTGANVIQDGDPLIGYWIAIPFKVNPDWQGTYFSIAEVLTKYLEMKITGK